MAVIIAAIFALVISGNDAFGQLDPTFHPPYFAVPDLATHALLLPDGKYVVYFNIETLSDQPAGAITRYLPDGTLDTSFNFSRDYPGVSAAAGLANGKLIVAAGRVVYGQGANDLNHGGEQILRLNADGSIDPSFSSTARTTDGGGVRAIAIQPDGKILVGGLFTAFNGSPRRGIVRLLSDGRLDPNFAAVTMTDPPIPLGGRFSGLWTEPKVQANGKILIAGDFIGVNGTPCPGVARLNANGSLDSTFQASGFQPTNNYFSRPIRGIVIQSNGQIVIGGKFTVSASFASNHTGMTYTRLPLIRLNSNGSADQSYGYFGSMDTADSTFFQIRALVIQPDNKVIGVDNSVFRFNTNGSLDATFRQPDLLLDRSDSNFDLEAYTINLRTDGRILIGGDFSDVDDAPPLPANGERWGVAEFNSDGTLDSFTTSQRQAFNAYPTSFLRESNGLTLIAFNQVGFSSGRPAIHQNYGRLSSQGVIDPNFDPLASLPGGPVTARGFAVLPNGNILGFGSKDQTGRFAYGVLTPDGMKDPNYNDDPNVAFNQAYPQPLTNGKVLVLSSPASAQTVIENAEFHRINSHGSLDTSFVLDPSVLANTVQTDMNGNCTVADGFAVLAVQSDGRILFAYLAADSTYRLVRLNPNGSLDATFQAVSVPVSTTSSVPLTTCGNVTTELSPDGVPGFSDAQLVAGNQIVVVGQFASYAGVPAHGIVRLNANGTVDSTFNAGNGAQWTHTTETATFHPSIDNIEQTSNDKFLITGTFEAFNGVALPGIALLNPDGSLDTSFVPPATRQKFDSHTAYLAKQPDNSFLLSGPYSLPNQTQSPSFIHIFGAPTITSPRTATATENQLFIYQVIATGNPTSYTAMPLPAGMSFDNVTGILGGNPTSPGTTQIHLTATNSFGTGMATLTLTVRPPPSSGVIIASSTSVTARTGQPFSFDVFTTGGSSTARLSATGLPPGLSVDPATGVISGTPTVDGSFGVTLTVRDGALTTISTLELTFTSDPAIPVITSPRETTLTAGQPFFYRIVAPSSDHSGTTFSLIGNLPLGLSFDPATGTISGTFNPGDQNGGALLGNVQLGTHNSSGTATNPLSFFQGVSATAKNISTRLAVGTNDNVLIGGFIVTGNASKKVIVRAIGPELGAPPYNIPNALADPTLELHDHTGATIASNDNWMDASNKQEIINSGHAPSNDLESAILTTLAPGNYTAIIRGKSNTTGNALVEVYDLGTASLDVSSNAQLGNISTRGLVQTGDNVMIGGFIVQGDMPATIIVRAIGPELGAPPYNVAGAMADPTLELHDGAGALIGSNDNWQTTVIGGIITSSQVGAIQNSGHAPAAASESAIIANLPPGNYTVIVRGKNNTTGIALVEGYVLQ